MNKLRASAGALVIGLLGSASADEPAGDVEADAGGGPSGRVLYSGAVELELDNLSWTLTEFTAGAEVVLDGFNLMLYDHVQGRFKNVISFTAIPWDVPVNKPIPLGETPGAGTIGAYFVEDALNREEKKWVTRTGTLTLTQYGERLSGEFHVELSQDGAGDAGLTARGEFVDIPAIHRTAKASGDACDVIDDRTFRSVGEHECGLAEHGVGHCRWTIEFSSGVFHWRHSDVSESGKYTCQGMTIRGESFDTEYTGSYTPDSRLLIWDGLEYER